MTLPSDLTDPVVSLLCEHEWTADVTVQRDVVLHPRGDLVECDVAREKAGPLIGDLRELGVHEAGSILVTEPRSSPFARAERMERAAPGHPDDAIVWESVESAAAADSVPTVSYHVFLVIAVILAAIAVVTDSSVLVVGAMVVGPDFAPVAAAGAGVVLRRPRLVVRALQLLVLSFVFAIAVVAVLGLVARGTGLIAAEDLSRSRPNTGFIWHPDAWSFIVALAAGGAGALALAIEKTSTMVGVFISVTTVPAAGNLALALAFLDTHEMAGSAMQLGLNLVGLLLAGTAVLAFQRRWWKPLCVAAERVFQRTTLTR
ncbi:DUF389 domain-containing protein [Nocardioides sp. CBS4Y-1]|uniref:DUF389 domain-containing protein n=2 Tax=Nocardioides acrostichi TaxID=2784339 RepID=A0A930UWY3_9ACTN|nr:DUF389 domain-containing protein [Nocardioides acrostichi]